MSAIRKILVVDDDPVVGKSFNRVLSQKGYVVITAQNAQEALNKLQDEEYDVVFTDIKMPGMDGLELTERVKAKRPWLPVVIVTGYGSTANEERAKAAGVSAFLNKPLSPETIEGSTLNALLKATPVIGPQEVASEVASPSVEAVPAEPVETARAVGTVEAVEKESTLKNIALFMAAPFIGLLYAVLFPFIGIGMMIGLGAKALARKPAVKTVLVSMKGVGMFFAAPLMGLAFVVLLPFIGTVALAWIGVRALMKKTPSD